MGMGSIPWTAIRLYVQDEQYDPDESELFMTCVMSMDADYLKALDDDKPKKKKVK